MPEHRPLVIGSKNHFRAECFDWLQPFPNIEEYDALIINMQSLNQENYDKIIDKIKELSGSISTIIGTNREIFCIINKIMHPSPPPMRPGEVFAKGIVNLNYVLPSNYDWLPANIFLDNKKNGDYIEVVQGKFENYFKIIKTWKYEIDFALNPVPQLSKFLNCLEPIAVNKSEKMIAGSLRQISDRKKLLEGDKIGMIHLLPPPEESDLFQAIEIIIDIIAGPEGKVIVPWRDQIEVPNERTLKEMVNNKLSEIEEIQKEISQIQKQIKVRDSYRDLLTQTGDRLENIVQKTLFDLGIDTKKTEKGFPADLYNKEFAIEITGIKGSIGADSNKIAQIGRFNENFKKYEKIVLIVNTYMDKSPKERKGKMNFSPEMRKYLESLSVCYMTTQTLFELWKIVIQKKTDLRNIRDKILNTVGELSA